jgi:hypothetical protein
MSRSCRKTLLVFTFAALTFLGSGAYAQQDCSQCDPYFSYCSEPCDICLVFTGEGCGQYQSSTCGGGPFGSGPCLQDNCTPNYQETNRVNVGTYDGNSWSGCTHHRVDSVTMTDQNSCNRNSSYYSYTVCEDWIDSTKNGCCWPSCCSGYGDNGVGPLSCNGQHSC